MNIAVHIRSVCFLTMAVISLHTVSAQDSLYFANETAARVPVNIQLSSSVSVGDVNGDGFLNVSDMVLYIDFILGYSEPEEDQFLAGDVNYSGQIDIINIVMVIDEILGN